jgi:hypothetical protein
MTGATVLHKNVGDWRARNRVRPGEKLSMALCLRMESYAVNN